MPQYPPQYLVNNRRWECVRLTQITKDPKVNETTLQYYEGY